MEGSRAMVCCSSFWQVALNIAFITRAKLAIVVVRASFCWPKCFKVDFWICQPGEKRHLAAAVRLLIFYLPES